MSFAGDLFEELSITELEDRLELVSRCGCKGDDDPSSPGPTIPDPPIDIDPQ